MTGIGWVWLVAVIVLAGVSWSIVDGADGFDGRGYRIGLRRALADREHLYGFAAVAGLFLLGVVLEGGGWV